ncbi:MAG: YdcF family protein [Spirochaetales bacterium]|nr:YdcF family protein [Leptospiraceae bacterium]MCP5481227.1 YdcF family protein [Spirochaetales bacterium]MCP5485663.1 YdcF family protein [Spirochaetales bacterium]
MNWFFGLSKLIPALVFPLPAFLILALLTFVFRPRKKWRALLLSCWLGFYLCCTDLVSGALIGMLEDRYARLRVSEAPQVDAVVILGGAVNPLIGGETPEFNAAVDRLLTGMDFLRAGKSRRIVLSGGSGLLLQRGEPEAIVLKQWLESRLPRDIEIISEDRSRNTAENSQFTARIARERNWARVLLVTSAFHMPRSVACFEQAGLSVIPAPTDYYRADVFAGPEALFPSASALNVTTMALKEYAGLLAYWLAGYI